MPITAGSGSSSPGIGGGFGYGMGGWGLHNLFGEVSQARRDRARYAIKLAAASVVVGFAVSPLAYRYAAWEVAGLKGAWRAGLAGARGLGSAAAVQIARAESRVAGSAAAKYAMRTRIGKRLAQTRTTKIGQAGRGYVTGQIPGYGGIKTAQYIARHGAKHPLTRARIAGGLIADMALVYAGSKYVYRAVGSPDIPFISGRGGSTTSGSGRRRRRMVEEYAYRF